MADRTITITLGIAPVTALLSRTVRAIRSGWIALRTWGMCPAKADYDAVLDYALKRADLERRHG